MLGLSTDTVDSHQKFAAKFSLNFPLLADPDAVVTHLYGIPKETSSGAIRARRVTFLVSTEGTIEKIWDPVKADKHNAEVLEYLKENP